MGAATFSSGPATPGESPVKAGEMTDADAAATEAAGGILGLDFKGLWRGDWDEIVDEDFEVVGDAYEAGVLGGVIGEEDAHDLPFTAEAQPPSPKSEAKKRISVMSFISNFVLSIVGSTTLGLA